LGLTIYLAFLQRSENKDVANFTLARDGRLFEPWLEIDLIADSHRSPLSDRSKRCRRRVKLLQLFARVMSLSAKGSKHIDDLVTAGELAKFSKITMGRQ